MLYVVYKLLKAAARNIIPGYFFLVDPCKGRRYIGRIREAIEIPCRGPEIESTRWLQAPGTLPMAFCHVIFLHPNRVKKRQVVT